MMNLKLVLKMSGFETHFEKNSVAKSETCQKNLISLHHYGYYYFFTTILTPRFVLLDARTFRKWPKIAKFLSFCSLRRI
jgi:hypothetical protein